MRLLPFTPKVKRLKPYLLLEISILQLRLYSIDASLNRFAVTLLNEKRILPGNLTALTDAIGAILSIDTPVRDLAIVMNSPMMHHQIIEIPPMTASRRDKVLKMEARHSSTAKEAPGAVSFWSFGKIKGFEAVKEHVLCCMLSRTVTEMLSDVIREKNFNWIGFSSHAQFVIHLLRKSRPDKNENIALVEVNRNEGSVTLFHANIWNMERHFLLGGSDNPPDEEPSDALIPDKLRLEVGRALQYFKQQVRNQNISRILIFGNTRRSGEIQALLESSFKVPVFPLLLDEKKFSIEDPEGAGGPAIFTIPHIVALHSDFKNYIDFVPSEWRGKKQFKIRKIAFVASAAILYILLGSVAFLYRQEAAHVANLDQTALLQIPGRNDGGPEAEELENDRKFARATERSILWQYERDRNLSELARELAASVSREMQITELEITGGDTGWQVSMDAEIRSTSGSRTQQLLHDFQSRMHQLPKLKQLKWKSVHLVDTGSPAPYTGSADAAQARSLLTFSLQGMLQYPPLHEKTGSD